MNLFLGVWNLYFIKTKDPNVVQDHMICRSRKRNVNTSRESVKAWRKGYGIRNWRYVIHRMLFSKYFPWGLCTCKERNKSIMRHIICHVSGVVCYPRELHFKSAHFHFWVNWPNGLFWCLNWETSELWPSWTIHLPWQGKESPAWWNTKTLYNQEICT